MEDTDFSYVWSLNINMSAPKTRSLGVFRLKTEAERFDPKGPFGTGTWSTPGSIRERTVSLGQESILSQNHGWPPRSMKGNVGGEMTLLRSKFIIFAGSWSGQYGYYKISNQIMMPNSLPTLVTPTPIAATNMVAVGTRGWRRYKPTEEQAGASQFFGELRDLPRAFSIYAYKNVLKEIARGNIGNVHFHQAAKLGASDYLNFQFGWLPFYRDFVKFLENFRDRKKLIEQLRRDNGKPVRRGGIVDIVDSQSVTSSSSPSGGLVYPALATQLYDGPEKSTTTVTDSGKYWFAGRFRYWIPALLDESKGALQGQENINRILFGASVTPRTLYQLTPWSWMVDWVTSTGDVVANMNDTLDNLTADYAYAMGHKTQTREYVVEGKLKSGPPYRTSATSISEVKQRTMASPYGFGILPGSLSLKQSAILAALGYTRIP